MKNYKLYIIDLDGTMYRGTERIEEAPIFIKQIKALQQDYVFLTNNSTKTPAEVVQHLRHFGIPAEEKQIYSTSVATAQYIAAQKPGAHVYMIGEKGLQTALEDAGLKLVVNPEQVQQADYVIIGLDRNITYEKLALGTLAVRAGATFISTNADKALPTERGLLPGNGSLTAVISTVTQMQPLFIGKPEPLMIDLILQEKGLRKEDALMIGDNYETDILAGVRAGIDTAIVYTGFSSREDVTQAQEKPTYEWSSLADAQK